MIKQVCSAFVSSSLIGHLINADLLFCFVQRSNDVDPREGEAALRARGRYSELVALYQQRGQHEAALDLLHTLTMTPQDLKIPPQGELHQKRMTKDYAITVRWLFCTSTESSTKQP